MKRQVLHFFSIIPPRVNPLQLVARRPFIKIAPTRKPSVIILLPKMEKTRLYPRLITGMGNGKAVILLDLYFSAHVPTRCGPAFQMCAKNALGVLQHIPAEPFKHSGVGDVNLGQLGLYYPARSSAHVSLRYTVLCPMPKIKE